jgi:hypothetical protein
VSTLNGRTWPMTYDQGRTPAREHGADRGEGLAGALPQAARAGEMLNIPRSQGGL